MEKGTLIIATAGLYEDYHINDLYQVTKNFNLLNLKSEYITSFPDENFYHPNMKKFMDWLIKRKLIRRLNYSEWYAQHGFDYEREV